MANESYWRSSRYLWGLYAIYLGQFQTPALLVDGLQFCLLGCSLESSPDLQRLSFIVLGIWIMFSKTVKLIPHLCRRPEDLRFVPVALLFSYLHGFINIYALCTLHVTAWGKFSLDPNQSRCKRMGYG